MGMAYVARDKTISLGPIVEYLEWVEKYLDYIRAVEADEKAKNEPLQYNYQNWTYYCPSVTANYNVVRVDGAMVHYDSIHEFSDTLKHQVASIKRIYAHVLINYNSMANGHLSEQRHKTVFDLTVGYNGFKFEYDIDSAEKKLSEATDVFVAKIDAMPVKLDRVIRQKELIIMKVGFAMGLIPAIVLGIVSLFVPAFSRFFAQYFWVFPCAILAIGFIFGIFLGGAKLSSYYGKLIPTKYGGYNTKTRQSYRVDDMDAFCEEVDVLMGEKSSLGDARKYIEQTEKSLSKLLLPELGAVLLVTGIAALVLFVFK